MNRLDEYNNLRNELEETPFELEYSLARAQARLEKRKFRNRLITIPTASLTALLVVFIIMVNTFTSFAVAMGKVPLLSELAKAVAFSPSLTAAIENEYVQPMNLEQTSGDVTARIEYVIVDSKQVNVFYTLSSDEYPQLFSVPEIKKTDGLNLEGFSITTPSGRDMNRKIQRFTIDFVVGEVPTDLTILLKVYRLSKESSEVVPVDSEHRIVQEEIAVADFTFDLSFDPAYTVAGELLPIDQTLDIDNQSITIKSIEIYPTHLNLMLVEDEANSAELNQLLLTIVDELGRTYSQVSSGISATRSVDGIAKFQRYESPYFSQSQNLKLKITGAIWLDKDKDRTKVNLANQIADNLPQGVTIDQITRTDDGWTLSFSAPTREPNSAHAIFGIEYFDEQGNSYNYWSTTTIFSIKEDVFSEQFWLTDYPKDIVYLVPEYTRTTILSQPIEVKVK